MPTGPVYRPDAALDAGGKRLLVVTAAVVL